MVASGRVGSFSPAGPVSTTPGNETGAHPQGWPLHNELHAAGGRQQDVALPNDAVAGHTVFIDRDSIQ